MILLFTTVYLLKKFMINSDVVAVIIWLFFTCLMPALRGGMAQAKGS